MYRRCLIASALLTLVLLAACNPGSPAAPSPTATATQLPTATATQLPTATATQLPTAIPTPTPTPLPGSLAATNISVRLVARGLKQPLYLTNAGDGNEQVFVVEKRGTIVLLQDNKPAPQIFLDITDRVGSGGSEQGLLSVAFHPRYAENGLLYVNYTNHAGDTVISRFEAKGAAADPTSELVLLTIDQPYVNHNGGLVLFGPDGYLYIGMGDGGSAGDPQGNGQNLDTLLGKMLRIDVDRSDLYAAYSIPPDNPWADGSGGRAEIWAYGLRNPWRFSIDRATGDFYIADVGQNAYEEVNMLPAGSASGANFGWNIAEGNHCFRARNCDLSAFVAPIGEYGRDGGCSITGGYVYRGAAFPKLHGIYFFGDYCSGNVWGLRRTPTGAWEQALLLQTDLNISSFGEDEAGELYVTDLTSGGVYQIMTN